MFEKDISIAKRDAKNAIVLLYWFSETSKCYNIQRKKGTGENEIVTYPRTYRETSLKEIAKMVNVNRYQCTTYNFTWYMQSKDCAFNWYSIGNFRVTIA